MRRVTVENVFSADVDIKAFWLLFVDGSQSFTWCEERGVPVVAAHETRNLSAAPPTRKDVRTQIWKGQICSMQKPFDYPSRSRQPRDAECLP